VNILLAEDDVRLGKLVAHLLQKEFHRVDWVQNGREAYDNARISTYDVIILDWMLPGENGLSVCKRLREKGFQSGAITRYHRLHRPYLLKPRQYVLTNGQLLAPHSLFQFRRDQLNHPPSVLPYS